MLYFFIRIARVAAQVAGTNQAAIKIAVVCICEIAAQAAVLIKVRIYHFLHIVF